MQDRPGIHSDTIPELGSSSGRGMAGKAGGHLPDQVRCTAVLQFDDVIGFEVGRMFVAGLAVLAPLELELGDQATPGLAVVDRLIGFRLWPDDRQLSSEA